MKNITSQLQTHLSGELTTLAMCLKLTRRDGVILGFTSHDQSLIISGVTYEAETGFMPQKGKSYSNLNADIAEILSVLDSASITESDILAGRYDFAEIQIFLLNYEAPADGQLILKTGWLGEITTQGEGFAATVHGLAESLSRTVCERYSPNCRANFGDNRCKINPASFTVTGVLTHITSNQIIRDSGRSEVSGYFSYGILKFTSGAYANIPYEVKTHSNNGELILAVPLPFTPSVGAAYSLVAGCDKSLSACKSRFNNAVNFRGEPSVPGTDKMLETSSTRSS